MIKVKRTRESRVCQGDILRDMHYIESVSEVNGEIVVEKIEFPLVIVLTQDCDLAQDHRVRSPRQSSANEDKLLFSVLVAPLYNAEHVYAGEHLQDLGMKMMAINKKRTAGNNLRNNETPRYHYLSFPEEVALPESVVDFKHYFSANVEYVRRHKRKRFVCRIRELYREDVSQRFASFLSRIGLP